MQLIRKYAVLAGITLSILLIITAVSIYPGGTMFDGDSAGFDWTYNFMSNLFGATALNGVENPARIWAFAAMIILPVTYALFFINMSKKMPDKNAAAILKYGGLANIVFTFLIVTSLHDIMLIVSTTLFWTCLIVITVFIFKTKLHWFKLFCIVSLVAFYYSVYLWGTSDWGLLPIMQKVNFVSSALLILGLEYFTKQEDFAHIKSRAAKKLVANS